MLLFVLPALAASPTWPSVQVRDMWELAGFMDVNEDGHVDLVGLYRGELAYAVGPDFVDVVVLQEGNSGFPSDLADMDGDGDLDVLMGGEPATWVENAGGGVVGATHAIHDEGVDIRQRDLDGDGLPDLFMLVGFDYVHVAGLPGGGFAAPAILTTPSFAQFVDVRDLTGDGQLDLVLDTTPGFAKWSTEVFVQTPTGIAPTGETCPDHLGPSFLVDLDRDGDLDVLASDYEMLWCENTGGGVLAAPVDLDAISSEVEAPVWIDVDGDIDLDLAYGNVEGTWVREQLEGSFGPPVLVGTNSVITWHMVAGDINGDRAPDLAWVLNSPAFGFSSTVVAWNPGFPDADGDGLSDDAEARYGTDPLVADTDGNGVGDYEQLAEAYPFLPSALDSGDTGVTGATGATGATGDTGPGATVPSDTAVGADTGDTSGPGTDPDAADDGTDDADGGCGGCAVASERSWPWALEALRRR